MPRPLASTRVDSKRRRTRDKSPGPDRRGARQAATRRTRVAAMQAKADRSVVAAPTASSGVVEEGDRCRGDGAIAGRSPKITTPSASRARVDAAAIEAGRVPSAAGTSRRKAKRAATGTSRVTASSSSGRDRGAGAAGMRRKAPLEARASAARKSSGVSKTARKR
jgi:hypothetical protein